MTEGEKIDFCLPFFEQAKKERRLINEIRNLSFCNDN